MGTDRQVYGQLEGGQAAQGPRGWALSQGPAPPGGLRQEGDAVTCVSGKRP